MNLNFQFKTFFFRWNKREWKENREERTVNYSFVLIYYIVHRRFRFSVFMMEETRDFPWLVKLYIFVDVVDFKQCYSVIEPDFKDFICVFLCASMSVSWRTKWRKWEEQYDNNNNDGNVRREPVANISWNWNFFCCAIADCVTENAFVGHTATALHQMQAFFSYFGTFTQYFSVHTLARFWLHCWCVWCVGEYERNWKRLFFVAKGIFIIEMYIYQRHRRYVYVYSKICAK